MKKYSLADYVLTPQTTISPPPGEWDVSSIAVEGQLLYILWVNVEPIDVVLPTAFNVYKSTMLRWTMSVTALRRGIGTW